MKLAGKTVVVSGGASGLGEGAVRYLLRAHDARVLVLDHNAQAGSSLAAELGAERVLFAAVDIADEAQVAAAVAQGRAHFGALHACFNFAGIVSPLRILDREGRASAGERFRRTLMVNLAGTFHVMSHCVQAMRENPPDADGERGVVVNIASGAAFDGQVGQSAYSASKAGVVGLSLPAARELAPLGIRVNAIAPGAFWTPMLQSLPAGVVDRIAADFQFPKRFGQPDEIASLCCTIVENAYLNGECIRLDGAFRLPPR
ncbi:MAG TPA: SDR family NAD(P)-dependent oxidoreductase [Rubrivivax sp.]|nr:SDR family NAD(P)-dependent oxidoreductase [Burkholderiales bacterium]HNT38184.1 SDR family NAD(P)-dependent oxidoreductase [Rubrivivax sp.]